MGRVLAFRSKTAENLPAEDADSLVARCRRGDREALGIVLAQHGPALERRIARLIGPGPDVEDVLQQTFSAAIDAFPSYRGEAQVSTWLTRIAAHVAIDFLRSVTRRRSLAYGAQAAERPCAGASPDDLASARTEIAELHTLLDGLSPIRRVAFVLHVVEGRPIDEVAALTGSSVAATKSRIFWARRALLSGARKSPVLRSRFEQEEER